MRLLGYIVASCLALALLRVVAQIAVLLVVVILVWLAINRPRETAGFILLMLLVGLAGRYPASAALMLGMTMSVGILVPRLRGDRD